MRNETIFEFLCKPETLESVTFLLTLYYDGNNNRAESYIMVTQGCSLTSTFDKPPVRTRYDDWETGKAELNKALKEWATMGYKTRAELGIIDKFEGLTHDERVKKIRQQFFDLYQKSY